MQRHRNAPRPPQGGGLVAQEGGRLFSNLPDYGWHQAKAATVSAQVSTRVRIASSEYEVMLTELRLNVTR